MRPRLTPPARALARALLRHASATVVDVAGHAAWRATHPAERGPYRESGPPPPAAEHWYRAEDGWRAPLRHLPAGPGRPGEPVLLAHAAATSGDAFRYGAGPTLVDALLGAGFSVFLLTHRGDRAALAPTGRTPTDFDAILERDVPSALARVIELTGFPGVHWVGHGLGAQLGLAAGADRVPGLATVTALAGAVRFPVPRSAGRRAALAASLLPVGWPVPIRWMARFAAPGADAWGRGLAGDTPPSRVRGFASHATDDVALGLVRQLAEWVGSGAWTSRGGVVDRLETLPGARVPLHALCGDADPTCPLEAARPAVDRWGSPDREMRVLPGFAHLDALSGPRAPAEVFAPLTAWLVARRRLAWGAAFSGGAGDRCSTR